jgi:hypothetical protein
MSQRVLDIRPLFELEDFSGVITPTSTSVSDSNSQANSAP